MNQTKKESISIQKQYPIRQWLAVLRCYVLLFTAILLFIGCSKNDNQVLEKNDIFHLDIFLLERVQDLSLAIQEYKLTDHAKQANASPGKGISKILEQFRMMEESIRTYPKIIRHSIAQNTIVEISNFLRELLRDIQSIKNNQARNQFIQAFNKLNHSVS